VRFGHHLRHDHFRKRDFQELIAKGLQLGKKVAVGRLIPPPDPEVAQKAGADYLILDEGELTIPLFLAALERGEPSGVFRTSEQT
jgi:radical SAM superfamily enzyme YgiQ (UPF0313 family)